MMAELINGDLSTKKGASIIGSMVLTVAAIVATYPATVFLLQYFADSQNTGALVAGGIFAVLAVILWIAALWGWSQVLKTRR